MGNARPDLVEPVPDDAPIVPVLRAGDDDDGALRVVSVAPPFRTGAEEIKRRNLAGGCDMGRARTLGGRPWATGIGAIHCRRIVAHGFHGGDRKSTRLNSSH